MANGDLRRWRRNAHAVFDRYWKRGSISRSDLYKRLANALGIPVERCHIGMFDIETCRKVFDLCTKK